MADHASRQRRVSLAGQLLVLQLLVLLGVLAGVLWLSIGQSLQSFEALEGRRALSAAESLAATPLVRSRLPEARPGEGAALPAVLESVRSVSGLTEATLVDDAGVVIASSDATLRGHPAPAEFVRGDARRQWTGTATVAGRQLLVARVPVFDDAGRRAGLAIAAREYPGWSERLSAAAPDLALALTVCGVIGLSGSWLLSRRLKRQTLGMEPGEIAALVEHREALLHGVKEGVVAVDLAERITVLNDAARELLGWAAVPLGAPARETTADDAVVDVLLGPDDAADRTIVVGDRLLVANRRPITSHGRVIGTVTTLRDRTELFELEDQLGATRTATGLLRAQTHEFANQLHTVAGLIQLGETDSALRFVNGVSTDRSLLVDAVTERIADPPLAALLIAKSSVAGERGVALDLDLDAGLGPVDEGLSRDLITVVGNLIDNALDAVSGTPDAMVGVDVQDDGVRVLITVQDTGPGVATADPDRIFDQGFSTKTSEAAGGRGFGLTLTRYVCRRRGGDVAVTTVDGAVFTATLRREPLPPDTGRPGQSDRRSGTGKDRVDV
ncbi:histidine kinase [Tersicoccus phoenicis]|uniref:histidine kinase n=1 Tax=Tersicoccus phoenicis TaxID=554083 RepID=A0A1R1LAW8_9MICC|nr:ATP-binding protein [Tersicoccus phoenicis]OMH24669.1 histidine kinase [Tersicoccus phoenicis]